MIESGGRRLAFTVRGEPLASVEGPFELATTVGVLAAIAGTLAEAGISLFAISTDDTDQILVRHDRLDEAIAALRRAGPIVRDDRST
jgi:hypothetical protein